MREPRTSLGVMLLAASAALVVAACDAYEVFGGGPWHVLLVIPVIWIALWSAEDDRLPVIVMAVIVTGLAIGGGMASQMGPTCDCVVERGQVVGIVWITVVLALLRKRARSTYKWINLMSRP